MKYLTLPLGGIFSKFINFLTKHSGIVKINAHLSIKSKLTLGTSFEVGCSTYHLKAILIGVVKQDVKRSAGRSGFMGKT